MFVLVLLLAHCIIIALHYFKPSERELYGFSLFRRSCHNSFLYYCVYKQFNTKYFVYAMDKLFSPDYGDTSRYDNEAEDRYGESHYFNYRLKPHLKGFLFVLIKIIFFICLFNISTLKIVHFILSCFIMGDSLFTFMIGYVYWDSIPSDMNLRAHLNEKWSKNKAKQ